MEVLKAKQNKFVRLRPPTNTTLRKDKKIILQNFVQLAFF